MKKIIALILLAAVIIGSVLLLTRDSEDTEPTIEQTVNADVILSTEFGDLKIRLYDETPEHKANFLKLASKGFYDDTLFHRVIRDFMIQGGDPDSKTAVPGQPLGMGGPGYTLPAEIKAEIRHKKGALSAARQSDAVNPEKRSSGSQFYVVQGRTFTDEQLDRFESQKGISYTTEEREMYKTLGGTPHLDNDYTVFGEVVAGLDVIDIIAAQATAPGDRPITDIKMTVTVIK